MQSAQIWLIGGTQESRILAEALVQAGIPTLVTVTTEAGRSLYAHCPGLRVSIGAIEAAAMANFIQSHGIVLILDASHPFATIVSAGAIAAAQTCQIPYLRYERATFPPQSAQQSPWVQLIPDRRDILQDLPLGGERVLLILGYRRLPEFQPWQDRATLFTRILPSEIALKTALSTGFSPDRILALRPPVSFELESALWQQWQISLVIAKASGKPGGEDIKRRLAEHLRVSLLLLARPPLPYPAVTDSVEGAIDRCRQVMTAFNAGTGLNGTGLKMTREGRNAAIAD